MLLNNKLLFLALSFLLVSCNEKKCVSFQNVNGNEIITSVYFVKNGRLDTRDLYGDLIGFSQEGKFCFSKPKGGWFNQHIYIFRPYSLKPHSQYKEKSYFSFDSIPSTIIFQKNKLGSEVLG